MRWVLALVISIGLGTGCGGVHSFEQKSTFGSSTGGMRRIPEVAALPIIGTLRGGQTELVIRGHMSPRSAQRIMEIAQEVYRDVGRRFFDTRRQRRAEPVEVCVFFSNERFERFVDELFPDQELPPYGFYLAEERLLLVDLSRSIGNLRHELVHPLLRDDFPDIPTWLNEGIASLYETAQSSRGGLRFSVDYRLADLRRAMRRGTLPSRDRLASSSYDNVHGEHWRSYYALGRYIALYLSRRGDLASFYRSLKVGGVDREHQRALLHRHLDFGYFLSWIRQFPG